MTDQITFAGTEVSELRGALGTAQRGAAKVRAMYEDGRIRPVAELNALVNGFDRFTRLLDKMIPFEDELDTAGESYPMPTSEADLADKVEILPLTGSDTLQVVAIHCEHDRQSIAFTRNPIIAAAIRRAWTR